jgi:uncharacterized protein (DUF362 family)
MSTVSIAREKDRTSTVTKALELIHDDVKSSISSKDKVLIKPNFVFDNLPLCATHVDTTRALIEFISQFDPKEIIIAESSAQSATRGYKNYNYLQLKRDYGLELIDLDDDDYEEVEIFTRESKEVFGSTLVRVAKTVIEADYRISPAVLKTHDCVIVTLSLKNMVMGSVLDKRRMHQGFPAMNVNLYKVARFVPVHLAIIDGWRGMEGNGPVRGTAVDSRVALASTDFVAADAVAAKLMGFNPLEIGYLQYAGGKYGFDPLGTAVLSDVSIIGETMDIVRRIFKPHYAYSDQKNWHIPNELLKSS